jgi:hypothetical protein
MPLIITEFASASPAPGKVLASQTVTVGAEAAASNALNAGTTLVRLFAEEDCNVSVGAAADAETDAVIALAADSEFLLAVHANSGWVVSVVQRGA